MLSDFTWNMNGYISKSPVNPSDDGSKCQVFLGNSFDCR